MKRRIALILVLALMVPAYIWAWTAGGGSGTYSPTLTGDITVSGGNLTVTGGDIFLDTGRKIDFGAGNMTLTHAAGSLAVAGGPLLLRNSTSQGVMSLSTGGDTGTGWRWNGAGNVVYESGSTTYASFTAGILYLQNGMYIGFNGDTISSISRESDGVTQLGQDGAASPAQTLKSSDGSGADAPGAKLTLAGGRPTGIGRQAPTCIASATTSAVSSSTQQTLIERFCVDEKGMSPPPVSFANLGNTNGYVALCYDCDPATLVSQTCASSGAKTGSLAVRVNGTWKCIS